jgi:DNA-binding transcriptional LysR family regulator
MASMVRWRRRGVQGRCGTPDAERASASLARMDLDLRRLRYFVAVAERLSFRAAAEELRIGQPALSRQIAALEQELGVTLLERDRRGVALTAAGEQLLQDAEPLMRSADEAMRRVHRAHRGSRRLVVGFRSGIVPTPVVRAFGERWPEVTVDVRGLEWDDQERLITAGAVDVGFVRAPVVPDGLRLTPLFREPRLVALPGTSAAPTWSIGRCWTPSPPRSCSPSTPGVGPSSCARSRPSPSSSWAVSRSQRWRCRSLRGSELEVGVALRVACGSPRRGQ